MSKLKNEFSEVGHSFNLVYHGIFIDSEEKVLIISKTDFFDENSVDYQTKDIEEIINEIIKDLNNNQTEETIFLINKFKRPELKNLITIPYSYNKFCEYINKRSKVIGILTKNIRMRGKHLDKNYINETLFTKFKLKYFYKTISLKTYNYYMYEDKMLNSIRLLDTKYIGE